MGQGQSEELQLQSLTEKYSLGKTKLGEGAYGTVWKGTDRQTGNIVAVKQMSKAKLRRGGHKLRDNMGREVVMMRACQHENIAQLLGVFQEEKHVYLVMECCEGGDLGERVIAQKANVTEEQSAEWSRQMCAAVASLHGMRICHRDLKPQNYMLRGSTLKLSDFGLAVFVPQGQSLSDRCGTPGFMSPELHLLPGKSRGYSFPADAWALGLCIYMLIFRHNPFLDSRGFVDESSLLNGRLTFGEDDSSFGLLLQTLNMGWGEENATGRRPEIRELCKQLICVEERRRITTQQALQNPWLAQFGARLRHRKVSCDGQGSRQSSKLSAGGTGNAARHSETAALPNPPPQPASRSTRAEVGPEAATGSWPLSNGSPFVRHRPANMQLNRSQSLQGSTAKVQSLPVQEKHLPNLLEHQVAGNKLEPNQTVSPGLPSQGGVAASSSSGYPNPRR